MRTFHVHRLGQVPYARALELQERLQAARIRNEMGDTVLMLEHPPTVTLGRRANVANVLLAKDAMAARGIELFETGRGGDVTYHGPGQLVCYPILDLRDRPDVRKYVQALEETMIRAVARFGVSAERIEGMNGTWVRDPLAGDRKIGAIGVRLSQWVSMHGFALNVSTDLSHFGWIVPCGIRDKGVTSLEAMVDPAPTMDDALDACEAALTEVFEAQVTRSEDWPELPRVRLLPNDR